MALSGWSGEAIFQKRLICKALALGHKDKLAPCTHTLLHAMLLSGQGVQIMTALTLFFNPHITFMSLSKHSEKMTRRRKRKKVEQVLRASCPVRQGAEL